MYIAIDKIKFMIILLRVLSIIFISVTSLSNIFSQSELTTKKTSTAKTVAIYSSKKSFFQDYPIDTLVLHLNSLNTNPEITYFKCKCGAPNCKSYL